MQSERDVHESAVNSGSTAPAYAGNADGDDNVEFF
jgi:hypothetical protein